MKGWDISVRDEKLFPLVQKDDERNPFQAPKETFTYDSIIDFDIPLNVLRESKQYHRMLDHPIPCKN